MPGCFAPMGSDTIASAQPRLVVESWQLTDRLESKGAFKQALNILCVWAMVGPQTGEKACNVSFKRRRFAPDV